MMNVRLLYLLGTSSVACAVVQGAICTWTGGDSSAPTDWGTPNNWVGKAVPTSADEALFSETATYNPSVGSPGLSVGSLNFVDGAGAFTITAIEGKSLDIAAGIMNASANVQTLNVPLNLANSQTWDAQSAKLVIGGAVSLGAYALTVAGAYDVDINSSISGTGGITQNGAGTLNLAAANSFSGLLTINGGIVSANAANSLGSVSSIIINSGSLSLAGTSERVNNSATLQLAGGQIKANTATENFGVLTVSFDSYINFLSGTTSGATLTFDHGVRIGGTLEIFNWSGHQEGGLWYSDDDKIFFANKPGADFLANVTFHGYPRTGAQLRDAGSSGWELVPVPEPAECAVLAGLGLVAFALHRRRLPSK